MATIIEWNGRDLPQALLGVAPGAYALVRTLTDAQKDAATLDIEALGVNPAYRDVPIAALGLGGMSELGVELIGDLEKKATTIARKWPGLWLRIPNMLRELPADYALRGCKTWREIAHHALSRVKPQHAKEIRLRLGLDGPAETRTAVARRLGVTATAIKGHEHTVRIRWRDGWSQRVKAQLDAIVNHQRMRVVSLMTRDAFFAIDPREERALALFIELISLDFTFTQKRGAVFIAHRRYLRPQR